MTHFINNNYNNIINMETFKENFNKLKIHKKLEKFNIIDNNLPTNLSILKPTLNNSEQELSIINLIHGQYVIVKLKSLSKIIVYRDLDGQFWEIAMKSDNTIIDIEPFNVNGYDGTNMSIYKNYKINELIESNNQNIHTCSIFNPNVFNCTKSFEYKMIIHAILNCSNKLPVCYQPYVKTEKLLKSIELFLKLIIINGK